ncbi:hypothetical protein JNUCC1_00659 [Lentibacillus sp. JNUCC-1]|uniref:hypothetical protein n=1 Tax=Lentibacillus sp. JNUCC-1 TaxID=2654513 RepID=UPI0012E97207|nr:hypothetical protein [Lentibacillus sp. JNUCC-1]MUV36855.1 hypothetical protein [Lentibacillus sp. JNUCC-1]
MEEHLEDHTQKKWYEKTWAIVLLLILFWPIGLFLVWRFSDWTKATKTTVTIITSGLVVLGMIITTIALFFGFLLLSSDDVEEANSTTINTEETENDVVQDQTEEADDSSFDTEDEETVSGDGQDAGESSASGDEFAPLERVDFHFDDRDWEVGFEAEEMGDMTREYVVEGESVNAWSELVTVQFFSSLRELKPAEFAEMLEQQINSDVEGNIEWNIFNEESDSVMYEFTLTGDPSITDQYEMARVISHEDGLYVLHYAIAEAPVPDDTYDKWTKLLQKATINE